MEFFKSLLFLFFGAAAAAASRAFARAGGAVGAADALFAALFRLYDIGCNAAYYKNYQSDRNYFTVHSSSRLYSTLLLCP